MRQTASSMIALVLALVGWTAGCEESSRKNTTTDRLLVVVSVAPLAGLTREIAGNSVSIETLLPPAANPTTFEPSMRQMKDLERASVVVRVGHPHFPLEKTWLTPEAAKDDTRIVLNAVEAGSDEEDPHVWWNPDIAADFTSRLGHTLAELMQKKDPDAALRILDNMEQTLARIRQHDAAAHTRLMPWQGRTFLVFHPAWGHFARHFNLRQIAVEGQGHEPGSADLAHTIKESRRFGIRTLFTQPQFSSRRAEPVAEALKARMVSLDPLAEDWFTEFDAAVDAIATAFEQQEL